ncbi:LPS-assembly protein LptD [Aliidiomarina quisquiliarum]|uniref:LPS-assembly protein LptD n=1 Tax=Aliidiomarina quisquiliarum TaxID=2938947 RepID=UPI00208E2F2E|nr:LPS assembly protein LptD [Aliidiomarina quisquiliarum]MCO4322631.1 LPS assembly protein LptD [Aliidiomarina quisquiliarum]
MLIRPRLISVIFASCLALGQAIGAEAKNHAGNAYVIPQQCQIMPSWLPNIDDFLISENPDLIEVEADFVQLKENNFAIFSGNVALRQENQWLITNNAEMNQSTGILRAYNGIRYGDGYVAIRANEINANMNDSSAEVGAAEYLLLQNSAYGTAGFINISAPQGQRSVSLGNSTFTTCPGNRPAWQIRAESITVNEQESWGTAKNAQFRIFDVPILYVPHFTFPLTDERKSGLLYPVVRSTSRNGLEVEAPWYFNIAPDRDATITPRYTSKRGIMLMGEYRQLTERHNFQLNGEYLNGDRNIDSRPNRHFLRIENKSELSNHWSSYVEFMQVSDSSYINDFNSDFANRADAHLYRQGQINYHDESSHLQVQVEDFQMLGPYTQPYRTLPRVSYKQQKSINSLLDYNLFSEFTHFRSVENGSSHTSRLHLEPTIGMHLQRPGWDWKTELSYLVTHYEQNNIAGTNVGSITRLLPQVRTRARLHLERSFGKNNGLQTLTPQIQYLYVPYRNQNDIGIYDTSLIQDDYHGLFRPRRFAGLDRIADAHQIIIGASTGIFDAAAEELMRISLGQIFYLDESKTQLFDDSSRITASNSELAGELDFRVSEHWFFSGALQYDTTLQIARKARLAAEYRKGNDNLIQLNYRKVRGLAGTEQQNLEQQVEQVGLVSSWHIDSDWALAAHLYQDVRRGTTMDALVGLQYESCCWSIRVSAYRRMNRSFELVAPNAPVPPAEFDNGVSIQFMLTGLGGGSQRLTDMLQQSIFGYRRPFYLSN